MDDIRVKVLSNELVELGRNILQETDKDKKIELYERMMNKTNDCFCEYDKLITETTEVLNGLNESLHDIARLSETNPKECRRMLKKLYKEL